MTTDAEDRRTLECTYGAAAWLAALAYPGEEPRRESFAGAIIARRFDQAPARESAVYEATCLACVIQDRPRVVREIVKGARVLNEERLEAAYMAWPQFCELLRSAKGFAPIVNVPTHASRRMLDVIGSHLATKRAKRSGDGEKSDVEPANIQSRIWKPSLPVLHMAISLFMHFEESDVSFDKYFDDEPWFSSIFNWAEAIRRPVAELFRIQRQWPDPPPD